jgi:GH25 family lysozyme M1 (1,4-beta-N-acetylmuramidase)
LITPKVKIPASYDISHYKEVKDFKAVFPRPSFFWTKATEAAPNSGYNHTDAKFARFFSGMMEIGCTRGAYHFHRKSVNPYKQAEHFLKTISLVDVLETDILILDVEEGGESASQLWAWFEAIKSERPDNLLMLYSRKNLLDPIIMSQAEREYFKKIPTIIAGYPYDPDSFSKVPVGYVPDLTKWGEVWLWQYSSHGRVEGITTELGDPTDVDLNWINPKLYAIIGDTVNLGEKTMANQIWEAVSSGTKVWDKIGGARTYPDLTKGTQVTVYQTQGDYLLFSKPRMGVAKKSEFKFIKNVEDTTPPPPPPNDPTVVHTIKVYDDGKISVDNGSPY